MSNQETAVTTIYESRMLLESNLRDARVKFVKTGWVKGTSWINVYVPEITGEVEAKALEVAAEMKINIELWIG